MNNKSIVTLLFALTVTFLTIALPVRSLAYEDLEKYLYPEPEKTISMNFTDADLENVLKIFSQQSGLNFIVASDIASKSINLYLENVPVEEALEKILSAHNLKYEINPGSNIFVVKKLESTPEQLMTRIYPLKFATVPTSSLLTTLSGVGAVSGDNNGIIAAVEAVLSSKGSVIQDSRSNSIVVSDLPSQFPLIENTIARLDIRIPQILIEAEMLDISKNTSDDMGVKFGSEHLIDFSPASRNTAYPFNPDKLRDHDLFDKEYTAGTIEFPALSAVVDFLRSKTDTKNLARPRILTLNNSTAEISIVTDEAIGLKSSTTTAEGTAESVLEAERVKTGVSLKVTPQANIETREITMAIEPKVTQVTPGESFGGQSFLDPEERGSKSILRVNDGDTIVLGGLLRTDSSNIKTAIPLISDVPIIGAPFRHKAKEASERELIIFITPHIVDNDTPMKTAFRKEGKIMREQSAPSSRNKEIEKELSHIEERYFNPNQ